MCQFLKLAERAAAHIPADPYTLDPSEIAETYDAIELAVATGRRHAATWRFA
jgi:hypothetical protein